MRMSFNRIINLIYQFDFWHFELKLDLKNDIFFFFKFASTSFDHCKCSRSNFRIVSKRKFVVKRFESFYFDIIHKYSTFFRNVIVYFLIDFNKFCYWINRFLKQNNLFEKFDENKKNRQISILYVQKNLIIFKKNLWMKLCAYA